MKTNQHLWKNLYQFVKQLTHLYKSCEGLYSRGKVIYKSQVGWKKTIKAISVDGHPSQDLYIYYILMGEGAMCCANFFSSFQIVHVTIDCQVVKPKEKTVAGILAGENIFFRSICVDWQVKVKTYEWLCWDWQVKLKTYEWLCWDWQVKLNT